MPGDLHYVHEKFSLAVHALAVKDGPRRQRLLDAYLHHVTHGTTLQDGTGPPVSDELADRIRELDARCTSATAVSGEGTIPATINSMSDNDIHEVIDEIVSIAFAVARAYGASSLP